MRRAGAACAVVLLLAGAFSLGFFLTRAPAPTPADSIRGPVVPTEAVAAGMSPPLAELLRGVSLAERLREEVLRELLESYYRPVRAEVLGEKTIPEMIEALGDPYTEYLTAEEYDALKRRTARSYHGVGLTVGRSKKGLIVTSALEGPAREAGIRRGDIIVSIDGKPARKMPFERSLALIKGEEGTLVRLTVHRPDMGVIQFTVVRQEVPVPAVRWRMIRVQKTKIGYIRLFSFPGSAAERVERATSSLLEKGAKGVILDLRDNPGGLLDQAVRTASLYLDGGVVCTIQGAHQPRRVYEVSGLAAYPDVPLVVLVNGGSASAAEILAAALRDHARATVVGERTYGKTSVQSIRELSNGDALKLTTATYRTPVGFDLSLRGLDPRIAAADDPFTRPDEAVVSAEHALLFKLKGY